MIRTRLLHLLTLALGFLLVNIDTGILCNTEANHYQNATEHAEKQPGVAETESAPVADENLQDNKTLEEPPWNYHVVPDSFTVKKDYIVSELAPHQGLLCPRGYFISKLQYRLLVAEDFEGLDKVEDKYGIGDNDVELNLQQAFDLWKGEDIKKDDETWHEDESRYIERFYEDESLRTRTDNWSKHGHCGALVHCLGFQACLFRFSIELCRRDAVLNHRKIMTANVTCSHHALWANYTTAADASKITWPNQTVHLTYKSSVEKGTMEMYKHTNITRVRHSSKDVFHKLCPDAKTAQTQGYQGNCSNEPANETVQVEELWKNLGRTMTSDCSSQLLQVFCAYQYNSSGYCSPPFYHKEDGKGFNSITMSQPGERPDDSNYKDIFSHPHVNLIPARIGFAILGHGSPDVLMDLLDLIYRPEHYYVFHIDRRSPHTREALAEMIGKKYKKDTNIRVISQERSVDVLWGGHGIQRAEMEAFEELMRIGVWDFSYMISGSDVPLRNIDDFAASLAPYRGHSFIRVNGIVEQDNEHLTNAWHSCDDHVFKIGSRGVPEGIEFYSHPVFSLLSRDAVELLVSSGRPENINNLHFYLSTMFVGDETYKGTSLQIAKLENLHTNRILHYVGEFDGRTVVNLCRHSDTTDACGQGPRDFIMEDLDNIRLTSHRDFFARKFKMDLQDPVRQAVVEGYRYDAYRNAAGIFLPGKVLRFLADLTLTRISSLLHQAATLRSITNWRVATVLVHDDCCCRAMEKGSSSLYDDFRLWLQYTVRSKDGTLHDATATLKPYRMYKCYPTGSLRMLHITTRRNQEDHGKPSNRNFPIPTLPMSDIIWLQMYLDVTGNASNCSDPKGPYGGNYLEFPQHDELIKYDYFSINIEIKVIDSFNRVACSGVIPLELTPKTLQDMGPTLWFRHDFRCPHLRPGVWTVNVREVDRERPFVYSVKVILADETRPPAYEAQVLDHIKHLWSVDDAMINEDVNYFYDPLAPKPTIPPSRPPPKTKPVLNHKDDYLQENHHSADEATGIRQPRDYPGRHRKHGLSLYDCMLVMAISVVFVCIISYMYLLFTCPKKKRPSFRITWQRAAVFFGFVFIYQIGLYIMLEMNFAGQSVL